jgi:ABC-2 type transport system permease protein
MTTPLGRFGRARHVHSGPSIRIGELVTNLALKQLRSSYKNSALGFGWSLISPIITIGVYATVFSLILKGRVAAGDPSGLTSYGLFLAAGIIPWQFTQVAITATTSSYVSNQALIRKVYLPRWVFPASTLIASFIEFLIELAALIVLLAVFWQAWAVLWIPLLIPVLVLHFLFVFGLGLMLAPLNALYRDVSHVVTLFTRLWFWLTPIIYPLSLIADQDQQFLGIPVETIYKLNPMLWFIVGYRDLLFDLRAPTLTTYAGMALSAGLAMLIGVLAHSRLQDSIVDRI